VWFQTRLKHVLLRAGATENDPDCEHSSGQRVGGGAAGGASWSAISPPSLLSLERHHPETSMSSITSDTRVGCDMSIAPCAPRPPPTEEVDTHHAVLGGLQKVGVPNPMQSALITLHLGTDSELTKRTEEILKSVGVLWGFVGVWYCSGWLGWALVSKFAGSKTTAWQGRKLQLQLQGRKRMKWKSQ